LLFWLALGTALPAEAGDVVGSALWAYGHYLSMIGVSGSLVVERLLIKPGMSAEEEKAVRIADTTYAVSLIGLLITGILRAVEVRRTGGVLVVAAKLPFSSLTGNIPHPCLYRLNDQPNVPFSARTRS
jgi:hypothetical protein